MSNWWNNLELFERIFWYFAIPSTISFLLQSLLTLIGVADLDSVDFCDGDVGPLYLISFRNFLILFMIFGWAGISFYNFGLNKITTVILALFSGLIAMLIIGSLFYFVTQLSQSGNTDLKNAVGKKGQVYIPIPANKQGSGKIQLVFQGALKEVSAITAEERLTTGTRIKVLEKLDEDTLLVAKE